MEGNNNLISSKKEKSKNNLTSQSIEVNKINSLQQPNTNNATEKMNLKENNNTNTPLNIANFINEMPFENLNDYYDIESSLFLKRVEKLNLKFFWTSECILNQQDIKYPYNKLFLILFKQISLYIEEITRLNKQLKQKNKIEKSYQIKIAQMKQKEKENILNKQMLKNLQRDNKLLEKKNEKNISEIDKLNKKLTNTYKIINFNSLNNTTTNAMTTNKNNFILGSPKRKKKGYGSLLMHNSPISVKYNKLNELSSMSNDYNRDTNSVNNNIINNKEKNLSRSIDEECSNKNNKHNFGEIINHGIIQCDKEIENLELIEDILKEFKNKNIRNIINNKNYKNDSTNNIKNRNNLNLNGVNNSKKKKDKVNNKTNISIKTYIHNYHKNDDTSKK